MITLEITRLDGTATKEEVHDAVTKALGAGHNVDLDTVVYVRKIYGGMQKATLRMPIEAARKLLEKHTIRVNWSTCQIRHEAHASASSVGSTATSRKTATQR